MALRAPVLGAVLVLAARAAFAGTGVDVVVLKTGLKYTGRILSDTYKGIVIQTRGKVEVDADDIKDVEYAETPIEYRSAKTVMQTGNWPQALEYLAAALRNCRNKLLVQYLLYKIAFCHEQMGDADKAIETYQKLLQDVPDTRFLPKVVVRVVHVLISRKEFSRALGHIKRLSDLGPDRAREGVLLNVSLLIAQKKFAAADRLAKEIYEENQGDEGTAAAEALIGRAHAHIGMGKFDPAAGFARKAVREAKGDRRVTGEAYVVLGDAYFNIAKGSDTSLFKKALLAYLRVPVRHSGAQESEAKALYQAGLCFKYEGKRSRAQRMFKLACDKYPSSQWSRRALEQMGE